MVHRSRSPSRSIVALALTASCALAPSPARAAANGPSAAQPAGGVPWTKSYREAVKKARALGRPLMVDFWADWCHWCHELDATTYRDPSVVAATADLVPVKIDTEGSLAEKRLAADYDIETLPTIGFLSPEGHVILLVERFEGPEEFARTLKTARTEAATVLEWESALTRRPDDAAALAGLGAHLVEQRRFDEGQGLLERALKRDDGRPAAERKRTRILLATVEARSKHYAACGRLLKAALSLQPADAVEDAQASEALTRLPRQ